MEQSSNLCHCSNFSGFLQKTTENISFYEVVPGTLVYVPCPRSTFAHATLTFTFLSIIHSNEHLKLHQCTMNIPRYLSYNIFNQKPRTAVVSSWDRDMQTHESFCHGSWKHFLIFISFTFVCTFNFFHVQFLQPLLLEVSAELRLQSAVLNLRDNDGDDTACIQLTWNYNDYINHNDSQIQLVTLTG